jgi:hypothetical protein
LIFLEEMQADLHLDVITSQAYELRIIAVVPDVGAQYPAQPRQPSQAMPTFSSVEDDLSPACGNNHPRVLFDCRKCEEN